MKEFTPKIQKLPQEVIHRIAAGEIVDRPASVLKELVENALDAHAQKIKVQIVDGGVKQIVVEDDGHGMSKADLEKSGERHATSKIKTLEDLDSIWTLGFRGEALAAISSVSRMSLESIQKTFSRSEQEAWRLEYLGGLKKNIVPASRSKGTKVLVEDLFFNIPARRKFLKKNTSEARECLDLLENLSLAHPQVSFEWYFINDKGEVQENAELPIESALERFQKINGVNDILEIHHENIGQGIKKIDIFCARPPAAMSNQKKIRLFVNGRFVYDKRLPYSMREAMLGLIEHGQFPVANIYLEIDPAFIDVNIHPQKKEIRWPTQFSLAGLVFGLLRPHFDVRKSTAPLENPQDTLFQSPSNSNWPTLAGAPLDSGANRPASEALVDPSSGQPFSGFDQLRTGPSSQGVASPYQSAAGVHQTAAGPQSTSDWRSLHNLPKPPPFRFSELRLIGEAGASWIICESPDGIILVDQHAAHERVRFEEFLQKDALWQSVPLLVPMSVKLPLGVSLDQGLRAQLESLGLEASDPETTAPGMLELIAVPQSARDINWKDLLEKIFEEESLGHDPRQFAEELRVKIASSLACHYSVRRGQRLSKAEITALFAQLDQVAWGSFCPHGRPVWLLLPHQKIEELFHR